MILEISGASNFALSSFTETSVSSKCICAKTSGGSRSQVWAKTRPVSPNLRSRSRWLRARILTLLHLQGVTRATSKTIAARLATCGVSDFANRSEEHTSELQSRLHLVCRLLLEKKNRHFFAKGPRGAGAAYLGRRPRSAAAHLPAHLGLALRRRPPASPARADRPLGEQSAAPGR